MTTTYSTDQDLEDRIQNDPAMAKEHRETGVLDSYRVRGMREILLEFERAGASAPAPADVAVAAAQDPPTDALAVLVDVEADIAFAEFREDLLELMEDSRPERDKSWVAKQRALRKLRKLIRNRHGASATRTADRGEV